MRKSLLLYAAALVFLNISAYGQPIVRLWAEQLPSKSTVVTYSTDGLRYAYLTSASSVTVASTASGLTVDTLLVPHTAYIEYAGARLYLMGEGSTPHLSYMDEGSLEVVETPLQFWPNSWGRLSNFRIRSVPNQPAIIVNYFESILAGSNSAYYTVARCFSTMDHTLVKAISIPSGSVSQSADGNSVAWCSNASSSQGPHGGVGSSSNSSECVDSDWPTAQNPVTYRVSRSYSSSTGYEITDSLPIGVDASFNTAVPTGIRGLLYLNNILVDLRFGTAYLDDTSMPHIICNLGPKGRMLGMRTISEGVELCEYDAVRHVSKAFDTLPEKASFSTAVNLQSEKLFLLDNNTGMLYCYHLTSGIPPDTVIITPNPDTAYVFETIECAAEVYVNRNDLRFNWYVDNVLVTTTRTPKFSFVPQYSGLQSLMVDVTDSAGTMTHIPSALKSIVVLEGSNPTSITDHPFTSPQVDVTPTNLPSDLIVVPNPTDGEFYIRGVSPSILQTSGITVFDISGQEFAMVNNGTGGYSAAGLPPGVYVIAITNSNSIHTIMLVK